MLAITLGCLLPISLAARTVEADDEIPDTRQSDEPHIVVIDGRRWRLAPPGTPEIGPPDTRIVLDERVYLDAERTPESVFDAPPATVPEPAEEPPPAPDPVPDAPEPAEESPPASDPVSDAPAPAPATAPVPAEEPTPAPEPAPDAPANPPNDPPSAPRDDPRSALRMPPATRPSSREFGYVDAMALGYERGGSGVMLEGSVEAGTRYRLLARIGAATGYRELLLGASWYATPPAVDRLTLVLTFGVETGRFELGSEGNGSRLADTGLHLGGAARLVVNGRLELQAGLGHGSFFEGDPVAFGGAALHVTSWLDLLCRFEFGGNDSLGVGLRFHY